jgi:hypothetical protein
MERPNFTIDPEAPHEDEKSTSSDTPAVSHHQSKDQEKDTLPLKSEAGSPNFVDPEVPIGEGEVKELSTAADIVTTVIHVDDDPTLNPWTFRMFFIGQYPIL